MNAVSRPRAAGQRAFPIVIVGHVDHGKSTLIGRLMHDTGAIDPTKVRELETSSARRGRPVEWSFLLDALEIERDQGITLDTTRIWFSTALRPYVIIDAPGHHELLRNMLTGAASADAAVLVVDAAQGLGEQTRRHATLLGMLGIQQILVVVNKIDLIDHDAARFEAVAHAVGDYLGRLTLKPAAIIPISARNGDNVATLSASTPWYRGPTLLAALDHLRPAEAPADASLRLIVQDVWFRDDKRYVVGRVATGSLSVGDPIAFTPTGRVTTIAALEGWGPGSGETRAVAGKSVALRLTGDLFVERGAIGHAPDEAPAIGRRIDLRLIWLDREPLRLNERLTLRLATQEVEAQVETINDIVDLDSLEHRAASQVPVNAVAHVTLVVRRPLAADRHDVIARTGRVVLARRHVVVAGAMVEGVRDLVGENLTAVDSAVTPTLRLQMSGHHGGVLWLTGLSGSGKSTLAVGLEAALVARGWRVARIDGDNLRQGLNRDLGFSPEARAENIRRAAEVAKLMADSGLIAIVSLISPYSADRLQAREIVGPSFREIHVAADIATCVARDPKGLYARAKAGQIKNFTGVDAPYEAPARPDLTLETSREAPERSLNRLLAFTIAAFDRDRMVSAEAVIGDGI